MKILLIIGSATLMAFAAQVRAPVELPSSSVLAQLPDDTTKRRFIIDCTNCHQMGFDKAYPSGRVRTEAEWRSIVGRMMQYAGAQTGFPIMSSSRDSVATAKYLAQHLRGAPTAVSAARINTGRASVREFLMPVPTDLPHDVAVDSSGKLLITGMFSHVLYDLDTTSGALTEIPIPVERANPRAIEIAANGDWFVLLGGPNKVARFAQGTKQWTTTDIGMYGHSIALDAAGRGWFNGHFTRQPEQIGFVDVASGKATFHDTPAHPTMAAVPGGPIPYELRVAPDGKVWMSELQGNRLMAYDPREKSFSVFDLPRQVSGPRRFDVDASGVLWIPEYSGNSLTRFDPVRRRFSRFVLPRQDAVPYIARYDSRRGLVWIGTNASDEVYAFDPRTSKFTTYALPSSGVIIRHMVVDPRNGDLWLAYGASPGLPARIARLRPS